MKSVIFAIVTIFTINTPVYATSVSPYIVEKRALEECITSVIENDWYYSEKFENRELMEAAGYIIFDEIESICEYELGLPITSFIWGEANPFSQIKIVHSTVDFGDK